MKFSVAAIATLVLAAVASAQDVPKFDVCDKAASYQLQIKEFSISPYPLCIGQDVCATGTGTLSTPVTQGARLSIIGKYLNRIVYTDNHNLCDLMAAQGLPCPIPTSITSLTSCIKVLSTAPAGIPVELEVKATNGDGQLIFCQKASKVTAKRC
ncbi:hypothetical protein DFQ27_003320 [Actinomortierella ambigua]|uniref:Phosphatidylglycerol/phosphatidylinositol transfer protein n=1 Tax=Actinomortierella ambigua TaxID=1343610 RepID=A0A9P6U607_9FUNG|nr:hypothetical protein DFQ26_002350 [Actinomortierella ambigua]KAG0260802.1 hypothetical protein DFQ27_003320 [Actinomortierella ambigua]